MWSGETKAQWLTDDKPTRLVYKRPEKKAGIQVDEALGVDEKSTLCQDGDGHLVGVVPI